MHVVTLRKIRHAIQNKTGLLTTGNVLLHDNLISDYPSYSFDLALSDYHLSMHLKKIVNCNRH